MRAVKLAPQWENKFWTYVYQDPLDYYFFIFDWANKQDQTTIYLALDEANEITGLLLLYRGSSIAQLRGSPQAAELLVEFLSTNLVEVSASLSCRDILLKRFTAPRLVETIILMSLKKGQEQLSLTVTPVPLLIEDAEAASQLMRSAYPAHWGNVTMESLQSIYDETVWFGIKDGSRLAAIGVASKTDKGSHIIFIATDTAYRNRGFATSIVSTLSEQILQKAQTALIFVVKGNEAAKRTYMKVGFKPYKEYIYLAT